MTSRARIPQLAAALAQNAGQRASVCGRSGGSARLVRFSRQRICCTDVGGDESGGYYSTAAGRPHHNYYYIINECLKL